MPEQNPIQVQLFRCENITYREFGRWGFKIRYNGVRVHKGRYDHATREDAMNDAKEFVMAEFPGCWRDKGGRRVK